MYTIDQLFYDKLDYSWCPACRVRGELINWAMQHGMPEVHAGLYMAGPGKLWEVMVTMGKDEMIEAIRRAVWPDEIREEAA